MRVSPTTLAANARGVCFLFFGLTVALSASSIGVTVNGTCEVGSCPAVALAFNTTETLPVDFTVTLLNGDTYLIDGSFVTSNNSDGSTLSNTKLFQVTYEGNGAGGVSAADSINVEEDTSFQTTLGTLTFNHALFGAFGPTIASSSSASSCVNGAVGCLGPVTPPGTFNMTNTFSLSSSAGAVVYDPTWTSTFGAGSPVGSYVVWGQTAALPAPAPEPATFGLLALGLGIGIFIARRAHLARTA